MTRRYDIAVIGCGIMGATAALRAAQNGMRVVVIERDAAGSGASGVNAGTLSLQIKRVSLMPYALRGHAWWRAAGDAVGFRETGSCTLAFDAREQALLEERMALKREAGAPIEFLTPRELHAREPAITDRVVAASWCAVDGHADSSRTGVYLRALLREAGVETREHAGATGIASIDGGDGGFRIDLPGGELRARRVLLACGAWTADVAARLGVTLPIRVRVNTVSVTEPGPRRLSAGVGHATGLLTLKQKSSGAWLIGGGWQGRGSPQEGRGEVVAETLLGNWRLARFAVPSLAHVRVIRCWTGFEAWVDDHLPLAGPLPGVPDAWVLACVRGGYTIGPCIGPLVADAMLGRAGDLPLFDPARVLASSAPATAHA
ncbi:MAG: FAD-binding oxidoreductase [Burkholderiales bacterium]|nr:FAD-binding oxidoreductase [Burkholderiales bacterium]